MVRFAPPVTLKLGRGEVLAWHQASARVHVVDGCAWVTQRNDLVDHFLHHGQCFELRRGHCLLISAEQDTWLRFERPSFLGPWHSLFAALWGRLRDKRHSPAATVAG